MKMGVLMLVKPNKSEAGKKNKMPKYTINQALSDYNKNSKRENCLTCVKFCEIEQQHDSKCMGNRQIHF